MNAIRCAHVSKTFRVAERGSGLAASIESLIRRRYREVRAVEDVSLSIAEGARVGLLGPNGAGKTTLLKMLSGLLHPSSGELEVLGFKPFQRDPRLLGAITLVMGQKQQLFWDLPPADTFDYNRAVFSVPADAFRKRLGFLVEMLEIGDVVRKPTRQLSLGERMKCELVAALLHEPRVLFLDEPTIGLDVTMQLNVRKFVRQYNERTGATVVLTSHYMDDIVELCPRVIVIDHGKLRYDGSLEELSRSIRPEKRITVRWHQAIPEAWMPASGQVLERAERRIVIEVREEALREVLMHVLKEQAVADLSVEDAPIEEVMRTLYSSARSGDA